jgi:hypothetical protein
VIITTAGGIAGDQARTEVLTFAQTFQAEELLRMVGFTTSAGSFARHRATGVHTVPQFVFGRSTEAHYVENEPSIRSTTSSPWSGSHKRALSTDLSTRIGRICPGSGPEGTSVLGKVLVLASGEQMR